VSCSKVYLHLAESDKIRGIIQNASCLLFSNVLNKKFYMFKYSPQDEKSEYIKITLFKSLHTLDS